MAKEARSSGFNWRFWLRAAFWICLILSAGVAIGTGAQRATAQTPSGCIVPRLYALTLPAAEARLTAAGCRLGGIAFERPRARVARITGQVPAPGAMLPRRARVLLLVS